MKPYFIWELEFAKVFKENGGFDVVIGNPPYVGEKGNKSIFRSIAKTEFGKKYYQGKMDLFYFFFHKGINISKDNGNIAFITTNYYITATGANILRSDFYNRTNIVRLVNFNEFRIFESALGQHNMITFLEKNSVRTDTTVSNTNRQGYTDNQTLQNIINENDDKTEYYFIDKAELYEGNEKYIRLINRDKDANYSVGTILDKIKQNSELLGNISRISSGADVTISRITNRHITNFGNNYIKGEGVFVINKEEQNNMILSINEKSVIKDFIKNSDIKKYSYNLSLDKLIYLRWEDNIDNYPNIKKHLSKYKVILEDQAKRYGENYPWFALHRPRDIDIFQSKQKILVPYRNKKNQFGYSEKDIFASRDVFYITETNERYNIKYILALLNSKVFYFWLYYQGKRKGETLELYAKPISEIPIKYISIKKQNHFINVVDNILELKEIDMNNDITKLQCKIDNMVYELFGFANEEIEVIENLYPV